MITRTAYQGPYQRVCIFILCWPVEKMSRSFQTIFRDRILCSAGKSGQIQPSGSRKRAQVDSMNHPLFEGGRKEDNASPDHRKCKKRTKEEKQKERRNNICFLRNIEHSPSPILRITALQHTTTSHLQKTITEAYKRHHQLTKLTALDNAVD